MSKRQPDLFLVEARRLAHLPAQQRKEALDVHRRVAEDVRLSQATRDHARRVLDTLENLLARILKKY